MLHHHQCGLRPGKSNVQLANGELVVAGVQAIYQAYKCGSRTKYPGTILHINSNGSYAICYDDGDHEDRVLLKNVYPLRNNVLGPDPIK